jgi:hypothetical protein
MFQTKVVKKIKAHILCNFFRKMCLLCLRKIGVKNWKQMAQERKKWKEIIEQAKTHKEL